MNNITCKGFRIIEGAEAEEHREVIEWLSVCPRSSGFKEIILPTVEPVSIYADKLGPDTGGKIFTFYDRACRRVMLRPEGTATLQAVARERAQSLRDWKVYYIARCFRYEQPQAGRYREFTQFGVEWLNPRNPDAAWEEIKTLAENCMKTAEHVGCEWVWNDNVQRGLAYYTNGSGFEISVPSLGAQKQVCGGGQYAEGCGFAFGVDRLVLAGMGATP